MMIEQFFAFILVIAYIFILLYIYYSFVYSQAIENSVQLDLKRILIANHFIKFHSIPFWKNFHPQHKSDHWHTKRSKSTFSLLHFKLPKIDLIHLKVLIKIHHSYENFFFLLFFSSLLIIIQWIQMLTQEQSNVPN